MTDESRNEIPWHRSAWCESGACVEVAVDGDTVLVRSSVYTEPVSIALGLDEWKRFVARVKDGSFDRTSWLYPGDSPV